MKSRILLSMFITLLSVAFIAQAGDDEKTQTVRSKKSGWLGVSIQDVTPKFAREKELKVKEGAYVNEVVEDSPADSSGMKEGDIITEFNGKKVELADDLTQLVRETKPGTKAAVKINRNGETKNLTVTIGKNKMRMPLALTVPHSPRIVVNLFGTVEGMELMDLNRQLGEYFEAPNGRGVLVKEVKKKSSAEKSGIKAGDVITKIGAETITDIDDVRDALSDLEEGEKASVEVIRKGKKTTVSLDVEENADHGMFWKDDHYNFRFAPPAEHFDKIQKELQMKLKELPRREKELQHIRMWERTADC